MVGRAATQPTTEFDVGALGSDTEFDVLRGLALDELGDAGGLGDAVPAGAGGYGNLGRRRH